MKLLSEMTEFILLFQECSLEFDKVQGYYSGTSIITSRRVSPYMKPAKTVTSGSRLATTEVRVPTSACLFVST